MVLLRLPYARSLPGPEIRTSIVFKASLCRLEARFSAPKRRPFEFTKRQCMKSQSLSVYYYFFVLRLLTSDEDEKKVSGK